MHSEACEAVERLKPEAPRFVYEVGSLNINGGVRHLFDGAVYHGIDRVPGRGVDAVADGATYEPPFAPDCVVCCEVLEHAPDPAGIVRQLGRVLAVGGTLIVTCAGPGRAPHSAVDGGRLPKGEHYANVQPSALEAWLADAGLSEIAVEGASGVLGARIAASAEVGDLYAVAVKR